MPILTGAQWVKFEAGIAAVASSNGSRVWARISLIAPSLMESENGSCSKVTSRSMLMAWV
jgi:hypothetical protein